MATNGHEAAKSMLTLIEGGQKVGFFPQISIILTWISWINDPIPGMFVFECIFQGDAKYSLKIPECCEILNIMRNFDLSSADAFRVVSINVRSGTYSFL